MSDFVIAAELSLRDRLTTPLRGVVRSLQELTRGADRASDAIDDIGSAGSAIDEISTTGARNEMRRLEEAAAQASDAIRDIDDPAIDGAQAKKELKDVEQEAMSLQDTLNGLAGFNIGGNLGQDLVSFGQMDREFQASLHVTQEQAQQLTSMTKDVWANVQGITKEAAFENVLATQEMFKLQGEAGKKFATDFANLNETAVQNSAELGSAIKALDSRFADIKGPQQALDMLIEARQKMPKEAFAEMLDQIEEYSPNFASAGVAGNNFLNAMVEGGQKGRYVMDRLGDSISNDLIANIKKSDKGVMNALDYLWSVQTKKGFDSETIEKLHDKSGDWEKALKEGGKAAKQAQKEMEKFGIDRKALKEYDELTNKSEAWREAVVKGGKDGEKAINEILSTLTKLDDKSAQFEIGSGLLGTLFEEQGAAMLPVLENLSKGYRQLGEDTTDLGVRNEGFLNQMKTKWKEVMGEIDSGTNGVVSGFGEMIGAALPAIGAFVGAGGLGKVTPVLSKIGEHVLKLGPWVSRLAGPWGIVIGAVVSLGIAVYQNWEKIEEKTDELVTGIQKAWDEIGTDTTKVWTEFKTTLSDAMDKGKKKVADFFEPLVKWIDKMVEKWENFKKSLTDFKLPEISLPEWMGGGETKESSESKNKEDGFGLPFLGWFSKGLDYVPQDGLAVIHKGERILTAEENRSYSNMDPEHVRLYATGAASYSTSVTNTHTSSSSMTIDKSRPVYQTIHYHAAGGQESSEFQRFFRQLKSSMQNIG